MSTPIGAIICSHCRLSIESLENAHKHIDINAKKPEEVAISILAQIIQIQNDTSIPSFQKFESIKEDGRRSPEYYINPVCAIPIDMNNAKHIVTYNGEKVYFCCDGCKTKFDSDPEKYMKTAKSKI